MSINSKLDLILSHAHDFVVNLNDLHSMLKSEIAIAQKMLSNFYRLITVSCISV